MNYTKRYQKFRNEIWAEFDNTVKQGTVLPELPDVTYPRGVEVKGLLKTNDGDSYFLAEAIEGPE